MRNVQLEEKRGELWRSVRGPHVPTRPSMPLSPSFFLRAICPHHDTLIVRREGSTDAVDVSPHVPRRIQLHGQVRSDTTSRGRRVRKTLASRARL